MKRRFRGLFAVLRAAIAVALVLVSSLVNERPVQAEDPIVPTQAEVGIGSGATMIIECKWELPDMTRDDVAMTYGPPGGPNDDTPTVLPTGAPCTAPSTGQTPATMEALRQHMMGISPNPHDQPIERQYEKWVAVYSNSVSSILDVYWKVWEPYIASPPGGPNCANPVTFPESSQQYCFKYQHHATPTRGQPATGNPLTSVACADLQGMTAMFNAAVRTGQMTQSEADYIVEKCFQNEKRVFRVQETISKEQPCGEYRVEVSVINSAAQATRLVNFFDVLCFNFLAIDFSEVNWGTILNGQDNYVSGDLSMTTPNAPTAQNQGNSPGFIEVMYEPLKLVADPTKMITRFDLKLRASWQTNPASIEEVPVILAGQAYCFSRHPIVHNQTAKIDFSVHPEAAESGIYRGLVHINMRTSCP